MLPLGLYNFEQINRSDVDYRVSVQRVKFEIRIFVQIRNYYLSP